VATFVRGHGVLLEYVDSGERYGILSTLDKIYRALQPVATCRISPYIHKPVIIIMTSFSL